MTNRQKRAFRKQWDAQIEAERNGAPVPAEIAARMTKPKPSETLWQVVVVKRDGTMQPVGPVWIKDAADQLAIAINAMVARGLEKFWRNAMAVPCTPIQGNS